MEKRVLVVDDIPINCKILVMHLNKFNITTDVATNGEEAVAACMRNRYTVVLMDLDMPVMDGFAATRLIRRFEQSRGMRTPILAVSSFDKPEDRQKCVREGMDGLLVKGLKAEDLLAVINSYDLEDTGTRHPALATQRAVSEQLSLTADISQLEFRLGEQTQELVSEFIFFARGLQEEFEKVIGNKDAIELTRVAYSLKGSCSNLGLTTLAALCTEISDEGYANNWHRVTRKYSKLVAMLDEFQDRTFRDSTTSSRVS